MLKVIAMERFSKAEYCSIIIKAEVLLYGECGLKVPLAAKLYRERFPEGPHPSYQTILYIVKRLRETG